MKQQVPEQFKKWHSIFRSKEKQVPDTVKGQLLFIAAKLFDEPFDSSSLSPQNAAQIQELSVSGKRALLILFKNLIKACLHETDRVEAACKVKFNGFFEFWKDLKLVVSQQKLCFCSQNSITKYELKSITIVNCRASKQSFDLAFKNKTLAFVKCPTLEVYNQLVEHLQNRMGQSRGPNQTTTNLIKNLTKNGNQQELQKTIPESISYEGESRFRNSNQSAPKQENRDSRESVHFMEVIKGERPEGYQIVHQSQNMSIVASASQPKIHVSMLVTGHMELQKVVNFYLQQKQWNSLVVSEKIEQLEENSFQVFRVFRKDSFFEYERALLAKVSLFATDNTASLREQSPNVEKREGKIICRTTSNVNFLRLSGGIKISIDSSFEAKGFYDSKDSAVFLQKVYSQVRFFQTNLKINQLQSDKLKMWVVPTSRMKVSADRQSQVKDCLFQKESAQQNKSRVKMSKSIQNQGTNDTLDISLKSEKKQARTNQFLQLRPLKPFVVPALSYIRLVTQRQHQSYYLKGRFGQQIVSKYDDYTPPYCLSELLDKKQYKISKSKELVFTDEQVIKGQKNSILFVMRQVGANLVSGKSVLNVSLPVDIFQPRSLLQRSAACFGMAPDYLIPVADSDPLTQIKNIVTLFSHIPTLQLVMLKPFNPILGQTFQAYIKGIPIYYEQISHHPPISSFYMTCPEFTMHGNLVAFADVSWNSALGGNEGITFIKMRNGSQFQCYFPPCEIGGLVMGSRTFRAYGKGFVLEKNHNILAEISIEKDKKELYQKGDEKLYPGDLIGGIFKIQPKIIEQLAKQPTLKKFSGIDKKNVQAKLAHIRGTWFELIRIDDEVMNNGKKVYPLEYPRVALPSDSNYRLDVLYHKLKDLPQSQCQKEILQTGQRGDRKLREKHIKCLKKQQK